jgi:hypothetical protein
VATRRARGSCLSAATALPGLKKLVRFLRSGDTRMVMVKPSPEFKGKQRQFHAAQGIPGLLRQLDPSGANPEARSTCSSA